MITAKQLREQLKTTATVAIIGGGIIGLSIAWRLGQAGMHCVVFDAAPEARQASWAAAGMLAPHNEARAADGLWQLGVTALQRWQQLCEIADTADAADTVQLDAHFTGSRDCAFDPEQVADLQQRAAWLSQAGISAILHDHDINTHHPDLSEAVQAVLTLPGGQVNPRRAMSWLQQRIAEQGGQLRYACPVEQLQ